MKILTYILKFGKSGIRALGFFGMPFCGRAEKLLPIQLRCILST